MIGLLGRRLGEMDEKRQSLLELYQSCYVAAGLVKALREEMIGVYRGWLSEDENDDLEKGELFCYSLIVSVERLRKAIEIINPEEKYIRNGEKILIEDIIETLENSFDMLKYSMKLWMFNGHCYPSVEENNILEKDVKNMYLALMIEKDLSDVRNDRLSNLLYHIQSSLFNFSKSMSSSSAVISCTSPLVHSRTL